jgi:hypothetical protein
MQYQEKLDQIFANGDLWKHRTFRTVLDPFSEEYKGTSQEQKIKYLKTSLNNGLDLTDIIEEYKLFYIQENKPYVAKSVDYALANLLTGILKD